MAERLAAASRLKARASNAGFASDDDRAPLSLRLLAYLIDTIALFAFAMVFIAISFINIFLRSDSGRENASDSAIWASVVILMLTIPGWLLVNLFLGIRRGQSVGQYVLGLRLLSESGARVGLVRLLVHWLALHPLLFHPLLAGFWFLFAYVSFSLSQNDIVFYASVMTGVVCVAAPLAGLLFALGDPQRRAIHDRLAGAKVVRLE